MNRRVYDPGDLGCCWCSTAVRPLSLLLGGGLLLAVGAAVVVAAGSGPAGWVNDLTPITVADWDYDKAAHLIERAGFGATPAEIERLAAMTPDAAVDELVNYTTVDNSATPAFDPSPIWDPGMDPFPKSRADAVRIARETGSSMGVAMLPDGVRRRLQPVVNKFFYGLRSNAIETQRLAVWWAERMLVTRRPLEEKLTLFWHGHFATGNTKVRDTRMMLRQNEMLRANAAGNFRDLLVGILTDPAMLVYLDNGENRKGHPNENFGRELLELFTMGVGNYTEQDIKECARAFTGWTNDVLEFKFDEAQHDYGAKTFRGRTGPFDGTDIIDIILRQPATAQFMARHLYNFFVADEAQVPAWSVTPPRDPEAVDLLAKALMDTDYDFRSVLRLLFNSDFFKDEAVRFAKVKSPADVVIGTMRMVGDHLEPKPGLFFVAMEPKYMGLDLMNPPTVEGWHMGREWINSGSLIDRINFASSMLGNTELPGVRSIIDRLMALGDVPSSEQFLDRCLDLLGPMDLAQETRGQLTDHLDAGGALKHGDEAEQSEFSRRTGETLQMIATTSEFQFG